MWLNLLHVLCKLRFERRKSRIVFNRRIVVHIEKYNVRFNLYESLNVALIKPSQFIYTMKLKDSFALLQVTVQK